MRASHGLLAPAARALGTSRGSLQRMVKRYASLEQARREARATMGDFAEAKQFELIGDRHWPAIQFYLMTQCRDRGYVMPKGTAVGGETTTNITIGAVNIMPIRSGDFVGGGPDADGANILGGSVIDPDEPEKPS